MTAMANAYELAKLQRLAETNEAHGCLPIWGDGMWHVSYRMKWATGDARHVASFSSIGEAIAFAWRRTSVSEFPTSDEEIRQLDVSMDAASWETKARMWSADHDRHLLRAEMAEGRLKRAMGILHNMALERVGFWRQFFRRWHIHHEPLRNDAANLVRNVGFWREPPPGTQLVGDDALPPPFNPSPEILAHCENCGAEILEGEEFHHGVDTDHCKRCAPTYHDLLASPGSFMRDEEKGEHHTWASALQIADAHMAAGGSLSDRMTSE